MLKENLRERSFNGWWTEFPVVNFFFLERIFIISSLLGFRKWKINPKKVVSGTLLIVESYDRCDHFDFISIPFPSKGFMTKAMPVNAFMVAEVASVVIL